MQYVYVDNEDGDWGSVPEVCAIFENLEVGTEMRMGVIAHFELKLRRVEYVHQIFIESLQI